MWYHKIIRCTGESLMYITLSYLNATSCPSIFLLLNHLRAPRAAGAPATAPTATSSASPPPALTGGFLTKVPFFCGPLEQRTEGDKVPPAAETPPGDAMGDTSVVHAPDVFTTWFYMSVKQNITAPRQKNTATGRARSVTIPKRDRLCPQCCSGPGGTNRVSVNFSVSLANSAHLKKSVWQSICSEIKMRTH